MVDDGQLLEDDAWVVERGQKGDVPVANALRILHQQVWEAILEAPGMGPLDGGGVRLVAKSFRSPIPSKSISTNIQYQLMPSICIPGACSYQGSIRRNPSPPLDATQADIAIAGFHHPPGKVLALGMVEQNRFPLLGFVRKLRERVQGSAGVCRGGPASTPATRAIASGQAPRKCVPGGARCSEQSYGTMPQWLVRVVLPVAHGALAASRPEGWVSAWGLAG